MLPPTASKGTDNAATASSGPEAITVTVPAIAPARPPLTGASTKVIPPAASAAPISPAACGPVVEKSTTVETVRPGAFRISSQTEPTIRPSGRLRNTVSCCATAPTSSATVVSAGARSAVPAASNTVGTIPAAHRLAHMGAPMFPSPINP